MSQVASNDNPARRRRADAQRSISAILDAAVEVLGERPEASIEEIATAAGVTRQTVYAHYASREALVRAVGERAATGFAAALDAAGINESPPEIALERLLDITWEMTLSHLLIPFDGGSAEQQREAHAPILEPIDQLVRRGQRAGTFDRLLPAAWLAATFIAISHTAAEELIAGRLSPQQVRRARKRSIQRLFGIGP